MTSSEGSGDIVVAEIDFHNIGIWEIPLNCQGENVLHQHTAL